MGWHDELALVNTGGGVRERKGKRVAVVAAPLRVEGKGNSERLGFGVEFDPLVEVLFRHCDNSNNAGLTGTVHEGTKARAEGRRRKAAGVSERRRRRRRRSRRCSFHLFRNVETGASRAS